MKFLNKLVEIPQWVTLAIGVILGLLPILLYFYLWRMRAPQLPDELKVRCLTCGGTNLNRWKEKGPNYIEYQCRKCGEIFYPNQ